MQLGVSVGSCFPFIKGRTREIRFIASLSSRIDGVEIIFAKPSELMKFSPGRKTREMLAQFGFVNLHYPFGKHVRLSRIPEERLIEKTRQLCDSIGVKHIVLHPTAVKNWRSFQRSELEILIENQEDGQNRPWQTPAAMERLSKETSFGICLDINHAMSCGIKPEEFLAMKSSIKEVHVNATEAFGRDAQHHFLTESSQSTLQMIRPALKQMKNSLWVIEARAVRNPRRKIEREIRLLRRI